MPSVSMLYAAACSEKEAETGKQRQVIMLHTFNSPAVWLCLVDSVLKSLSSENFDEWNEEILF